MFSCFHVFLLISKSVRRFIRFLTTFTSVLLAFGACTRSFAQTSPDSVAVLRCENLENPLGLATDKPRLTWIASSTRRGDRQTAYEVRVAGSADILAKDRADIWDSGRIESTENAVIFDRPLVSRQRCVWQVRVWDVDGKPTAWSEPQFWEMGLLAPEEWKAKWIDAGKIKFETNVPVTLVHASYEAEDGAGGKDVTDLLGNMLKTGVASVPVTNDTFGGDPAYLHVKFLKIIYRQGDRQESMIAPENSTLDLPFAPESLPYVRKAFTVSRPIERARLYATALGLYELHLNGARVGDHAFAPDWTDYNKRVRYQEYDVTSLLHPGGNVLAGIVGDGWYCGHLGNGGFQQYGTRPALLCQLEITYADGTRETIATDESWKMYPSPIISSDFMLGENFDAGREVSGWDSPSLDDGPWMPVTVRAQEHHFLDAQVDQPVREVRELKPKTVSEPSPGRWIFDLGQNMVGVVRLKVSAPAGTQVTIRHGEMLNADHTLYTANLRGAISVDSYICRGGGTEIWQPRFTFHGFRYVELSGLPIPPAEDAVTGIVLATDTPQTGTFACSNALLNQLYSNICWGQRGNYLSIPTDCPQRDERLGWMGDAQVFVRTATCNADVAAFFSKWLVDVDDAQRPDGAFTDVSPYRGSGAGTPGWADAGVICPWTIYRAYGDKRILQEHLPAMKQWVEWCRLHSTNLLRDKDRGSDYGDWLAIGADTPHDLIGTAFFAYSTHLLAQACEVVGDHDGATKYRQLFEDIKSAFDRQYVRPDGHMNGDTQCDYAMALKFELLPDDLRPRVAQLLADNIQAHGDHLTTGFLGVGYLLPTLAEGKKLDTAYRLLLQETFPSWLFSVKQGATTIWERWDGWTPDKGFQDPTMNSFNHYSLGSCGQWLFETVAGIALDPQAAGYANVLIHPQPGGGITWADGSLQTVRGLVTTHWTMENGAFTLDCTIPMNATATIILPTGHAEDIAEGGRPLNMARDITVQPRTGSDAATVLSVASGSYHFTCDALK
jgi:alpha-L-rhamnosidase